MMLMSYTLMIHKYIGTHISMGTFPTPCSIPSGWCRTAASYELVCKTLKHTFIYTCIYIYNIKYIEPTELYRYITLITYITGLYMYYINLNYIYIDYLNIFFYHRP